ncbi:MAG: hypothetical protein L0Y76_05685, partial [Ignavibacteria bacterium]|nr:hypothetical protein [Ignavibacteria bacterium]
KNLSEFLAVITRKSKTQLGIKDALSILKLFLKILYVLYPTPDSFTLFQQLLTKCHPVGLRVHDFEIASIALANKIHRFATFNEKDFYNIKSLELVSV